MPIKNFDVQILDENDSPELVDGKTLLALDIVKKCLTLDVPVEGLEDKISGEDKFKRYELRQRIKKGGDLELSPEEIVLLKKLIGYAFNVNAVGQLYRILNS